jgi:thiosulfate dehydrogenase [quinone] large subunit
MIKDGTTQQQGGSPRGIWGALLQPQAVAANRAHAIAALRIVMGWVFLYAGLEKLFNFGGTGIAFSAAGWLKTQTGGTWPGVAPTAIVNPTHDFWVWIGNNASAASIVSTLVVLGELGIGLALMLGLGTRAASALGTLLLLLLFVAGFDFGTGVANEQLVFAIVTAALGYMAAGDVFGLDALLEKSDAVRRRPGLRFLLA